MPQQSSNDPEFNLILTAVDVASTIIDVVAVMIFSAIAAAIVMYLGLPMYCLVGPIAALFSELFLVGLLLLVESPVSPLVCLEIAESVLVHMACATIAVVAVCSFLPVCMMGYPACILVGLIAGALNLFVKSTLESLWSSLTTMRNKPPVDGDVDGFCVLNFDN